MSLSNLSIPSGATWAPTGGSALAFAPDGRRVNDGLSLVVTADTNLATRRSLSMRSTLPALPASPTTFAKLGRCFAVYKVPFLASDGKLYIQAQKIETAFHPEFTLKANVISDLGALMLDADTTQFWINSLLT